MTKATSMRLKDYLEGMRMATTADGLEDAIQAPYKHPFSGRVWTTICRVRIEAGRRIVTAHPHAFYIPQFTADRSRKLSCCGESYRVGYGQNSTGVRYCWHAAGQFVQDVLRRNGFGIRAAYRMWDSAWQDYPHRCISLVDAILAGKVPDPEIGVLIRRKGVSPINYTVERNDADKWDRRATKPCPCGGVLFDWGGGHTEGFDFINWHCNRCSDVFIEYMTPETFRAHRQRKLKA